MSVSIPPEGKGRAIVNALVRHVDQPGVRPEMLIIVCHRCGEDLITYIKWGVSNGQINTSLNTHKGWHYDERTGRTLCPKCIAEGKTKWFRFKAACKRLFRRG